MWERACQGHQVCSPYDCRIHSIELYYTYEKYANYFLWWPETIPHCLWGWTCSTGQGWEQRLHDATASGNTWLGFLEHIPLALRAEVKHPLVLAAFLTALRAFVEQMAPGMTQWERLFPQADPT